jgi:hypothetical protein
VRAWLLGIWAKVPTVEGKQKSPRRSDASWTSGSINPRYTSAGHEDQGVMGLASDWNLHVDGGYQIDIVRGKAVVVVSKKGRPHRSPHQNRSFLSYIRSVSMSRPSGLWPRCVGLFRFSTGVRGKEKKRRGYIWRASGDESEKMTIRRTGVITSC